MKSSCKAVSFAFVVRKEEVFYMETKQHKINRNILINREPQTSQNRGFVTMYI